MTCARCQRLNAEWRAARHLVQQLARMVAADPTVIPDMRVAQTAVDDIRAQLHLHRQAAHGAVQHP